jgi:hypothetical protein
MHFLLVVDVADHPRVHLRGLVLVAILYRSTILGQERGLRSLLLSLLKHIVDWRYSLASLLDRYPVFVNFFGFKLFQELVILRLQLFVFLLDCLGRVFLVGNSSFLGHLLDETRGSC